MNEGPSCYGDTYSGIAYTWESARGALKTACRLRYVQVDLLNATVETSAIFWLESLNPSLHKKKLLLISLSWAFKLSSVLSNIVT